MQYQWAFGEVHRGYTLREPINSEFFSTEAIKNHAEAVVREAVQNSLDARSPASSTIRVHLSIVTPASNCVAHFTEGLVEHLRARRNGLRDHSFISQPSRALVVEDFNTTGLTGDPSAYFWVENRPNPFYSFFRAEGHSDKGASERGRWGVGKFVFPRCSRGSTYFGYSVRHDDKKPLLMGRTILRSHHVGGKHFVPDGYFGVEQNQLVMPVEEPEVLSRFRHCFKMRRSTEAGLSVVVPWIDDEIQFEALSRASISSYFLAILAGALELTIEEGQRSVVLTSRTLLGELRAFGTEFEKETGPLVRLAEWAVNDKSEPIVTTQAPDSGRAPRWSEAMISKEQVQRLREALEGTNRVRVRVPVEVRVKSQPAEPSSLDIILEKAPDASDDRPVFVREGLVISDAKGRVARGLRSLVLIERGPLGTLLGDAENPSHTEWRSDGANYREKYVFGPSYLTFVREGVARLNTILLDAEDKVDRHILNDFFSITRKEDGSQPNGGPGKDRKKSRPDPVPGIPSSPARVRVARVKGGFRVSDGEAATTGMKIMVRVAYDVRKGSPLKRWDPADFDVGSRAIVVTESSNAEIDSKSENTFKLTVTGRPFGFAVTGFDENRDLFVKADPILTDHASPTSELHIAEEA